MARIATLLPHVKCFGGVRRFIELGNVLTDQGHDFKIASANPQWEGWMEKRFPIVSLDDNLVADHIWSGHATDGFFRLTFSSRFQGKRWMWIIASSDAYTSAYVRGIHNYAWSGAFANNGKFQSRYEKLPIDLHVVQGGINTDFFRTKKFKVGYYNARGRGHKNTEYIESSCKGLEHVELVPISGLFNEDLMRAYQSLDYLVSWEAHGGWCNTAAEALSCGVSIVTNGVNCEPFIEHVTVVKDLRQYFVNLGSRMDKFSWKSAAKKVVDIMGI
jgi:hypothetical protein